MAAFVRATKAIKANVRPDSSNGELEAIFYRSGVFKLASCSLSLSLSRSILDSVEGEEECSSARRNMEKMNLKQFGAKVPLLINGDSLVSGCILLTTVDGESDWICLPRKGVSE